MADELKGRTIAFLAAEGVEQVELTEPWKAVEQAGGAPELVSVDAGQVQAFDHLDRADTLSVDRTAADADASDYDGLVLPGGVANADFLRTDPDAVRFVRGFFEHAKPGRGHLPRSVDARRGGRRAGSHAHLLAVAADRPAQRGRDVGGRGGPRRPGARELAQAGRPAGVLRQAGRGAGRGSARRAAAQCHGLIGTAVLDIDGTLVDTNYRHAIAWFRAFRQHGFVLPLWRIHRHIGMGGDQLVAALAGEGFASSAKAEELEHYLTLLDARSLADAWTDSSDVAATKPPPDLLLAALAKVGAEAAEAVLVGDSVWDCRAAERAGVRSVGVLTGGFSKEELTEAGASRVCASAEDLRQSLDETPLRV